VCGRWYTFEFAPFLIDGAFGSVNVAPVHDTSGDKDRYIEGPGQGRHMSVLLASAMRAGNHTEVI
jgi:hypothetical protein